MEMHAYEMRAMVGGCLMGVYLTGVHVTGVYCGRDKGMSNGRLYDREGMAMMGRRSLETRLWVESLLDAICVCPRYL
jgi:hypothetical protein